MKFFASKSSRLLLRTVLIYLALSLLLLLLPPTWTGPVRAVALYPFALLQDAVLTVGAPVEEGIGRLTGLWRATGEAAALREENAALRAKLIEETERSRAAQLLLSQLNQLPAETRAGAVAATVTGYDTSPLRRSAVFNKGSRDGVLPNATAFWNGAVVGRVSAVDLWSCRVLLIGDRDCVMGVRCARTRVRGMLRGIGGDRAMIDGIEPTADVQPGDRFVTSGEDRIFPPGFLVGECIDASNVTGEMFKSITLKPAFDRSVLEHVTLVPPEERR